MEQQNPYSAPVAAPPPLPVREIPDHVKIDDPTSLGVWSLILLTVFTAIDLVDHIRLSLTGIGGDPMSDAFSSFTTFGFLAYLVAYLCWVFRVLSNARRVDPEQQTITPGWGVGSHFVPIAFFWVPLRGLMQASRISGTNQGVLILWWVMNWGIFVAAMGYGIWLFYEADYFDVIGDYLPLTMMDHLMIVAGLISLVLEFLLITRLNRVHRAWATRVTNLA